MADPAPIDISIPFSPRIPPWPGDTPFECGWTARKENGSSVNLARVAMSAHSGTHADAPLHVESAWSASESLPLDAFTGDALVIGLPLLNGEGGDHAATIDAAMLQRAIAGHAWAPRILIRTGVQASERGFPDAWSVLGDDAAGWLVSRGIRLLGVDCPSVDTRHSTTLPIHHTLFGAGAYVLENLALAGVADGRYELRAAPLLIVGADAAPVRALLYPLT